MNCSLIVFLCLLLLHAVVLKQHKYAYSSPSVDTLSQKFGPVRHIAVLFRHGDRSPAHTYSKDPYKNYQWLHGLGQLTNTGKVKMVELGHWFKKEYAHLIDDIYKSDQVFLQSSDVDRAIMSGLCFLRGLYSAKPAVSWMADESWQPVPLRTIPYECDYMLSFHFEHFEVIIRNISSEYEVMYQRYEKTIKYIEEHSGWKFSNKSYGEALLDMVYFFQILSAQVENNLTLPKWTEKFQRDDSLFHKILQLGLRSQKKTKLGAGPFIHSVISDMKAKITNPSSVQTVHIYSGHDLTIMNIMIALSIFNDIQPPYSSTLLIELRSYQNDSDYFVTVRYKNSSSSVYTLNIPECRVSGACTFNKFYSLAMKLIPDNWRPDCELNYLHTNSADTVHVRVGVDTLNINFLFVIFSILSFVILYSKLHSLIALPN